MPSSGWARFTPALRARRNRLHRVPVASRNVGGHPVAKPSYFGFPRFASLTPSHLQPANSFGNTITREVVSRIDVRRSVATILADGAGLNQGRDMKFATILLAAAFLVGGVRASNAVVRIADDRGGRIGTYLDKYHSLRTSGETVIVDGLCASACTIVLGIVPHDKICVTSRANFGFHAAWDLGASGREVINPGATRTLYSMYPSLVRRWIAARGGLKPQLIFLHGEELMSMYRSCYFDAQASLPR
jgi:hypothetical protein